MFLCMTLTGSFNIESFITNACVVWKTRLLREAHKGVYNHQYITTGNPSRKSIPTHEYLSACLDAPTDSREEICSHLHLKLQPIMGFDS